MLLTINNLPLNMVFRDIKALIQEKCGLNKFTLSDLVRTQNGRKINVRLKDDGDSAILMRHFNGMYLNGNQLFVERNVEQQFASGQNVAPKVPAQKAVGRGGRLQTKAPMKSFMGEYTRDNFNDNTSPKFDLNRKRPFYQIDQSLDTSRNSSFSYGEASNSRSRRDDSIFDEPTFDDSRYVEPRFDKSRYEEPRIDESRYEEPRFDESRYEEPRFDESRYEEPRFDESRYEEPRFDESRYEEPRFDESRYDEPRSGTLSNRDRKRNKRIRRNESRERLSNEPAARDVSPWATGNMGSRGNTSQVFSPANNKFQQNIPFPMGVNTFAIQSQFQMANSPFNPVMANNQLPMSPFMANNQLPCPPFMGNYPFINQTAMPNNNPMNVFRPNLNAPAGGMISYPKLTKDSFRYNECDKRPNIHFKLDKTKGKASKKALANFDKDSKKYKFVKGNNLSWSDNTFSRRNFENNGPPGNNNKKNDWGPRPNMYESNRKPSPKVDKSTIAKIIQQDQKCRNLATERILQGMKAAKWIGKLLTYKEVKKYVRNGIAVRIETICSGDCDLRIDDLIRRYRLKHAMKKDLKFVLGIKDRVDILSGRIKPEEAGQGLTKQLQMELNMPLNIRKALNKQRIGQKGPVEIGDKSDSLMEEIDAAMSMVEEPTDNTEEAVAEPEDSLDGYDSDKQMEQQFMNPIKQLLYKLPAKENEVLTKDMDEIKELMMKTFSETRSTADVKKRAEIKKRMIGVIIASTEVLRDLTAKRVLGKKKDTMVRLVGEPKLPGLQVLTSFLEQFDTTPVKEFPNVAGVVTKCKTYEGYDKLCALKQFELGGCTVTIKPFQLVNPAYLNYINLPKRSDDTLDVVINEDVEKGGEGDNDEDNNGVEEQAVEGSAVDAEGELGTDTKELEAAGQPDEKTAEYKEAAQENVTEAAGKPDEKSTELEEAAQENVTNAAGQPDEITAEQEGAAEENITSNGINNDLADQNGQEQNAEVNQSVPDDDGTNDPGDQTLVETSEGNTDKAAPVEKNFFDDINVIDEIEKLANLVEESNEKGNSSNKNTD